MLVILLMYYVALVYLLRAKNLFCEACHTVPGVLPSEPVSYTHLDVYKRQILDNGRDTLAYGHYRIRDKLIADDSALENNPSSYNTS